MNLHPESELERIRKNLEVAGTNLLNAGLPGASALAAYQAVLFAGGTAELAFEAARRQCLLEFPPLEGEVLSAEQRRRDEGGAESALLRRRKTARAELIARLRSAPNPFAQGVESLELPLGEAA